MAGFTAYSSLS